MIDYFETVERNIETIMNALFPLGSGRATYARVQHALNQIAKMAFTAGRSHALMGLMTAQDVAAHFQISESRARALMANRHERFGVGMKFGKSWLVHRDELGGLEPEVKHRRKPD
jgi:predicted YcjX-like family ATPase